MAHPATLSPVEEVVDFFAHAPSHAEIVTFELSDAAHDRLHDLLGRHAAGIATSNEQHELDQMVLLDDILSLIRARAQRSTASEI